MSVNFQTIFVFFLFPSSIRNCGKQVDAKPIRLGVAGQTQSLAQIPPCLRTWPVELKTCSSLVRLLKAIGMATYRGVITVDWSERMTLLVVFKEGSANLMSQPQAYP